MLYLDCHCHPANKEYGCSQLLWAETHDRHSMLLAGREKCWNIKIAKQSDTLEANRVASNGTERGCYQRKYASNGGLTTILFRNQVSVMDKHTYCTYLLEEESCPYSDHLKCPSCKPSWRTWNSSISLILISSRIFPVQLCCLLWGLQRWEKSERGTKRDNRDSQSRSSTAITSKHSPVRP